MTKHRHSHKNKVLATLLCLTIIALVGCSISPADKERRFNEYFRQANENVGALECNQVIHARNLSAADKERILQRDGRRCAICGSTKRLEVDHKRAIMNGGNNSPDNLDVLCDDCHKAKTRMDNALRRKRNRLCRQ